MKKTDENYSEKIFSTTLLLLLGLSGFLLWAALFEIDQTVRSQGQLIPSARTQVIQAADGGILYRILFQEGQKVNADEPLAELERDRSNAAYQESRAKNMALSASLVRAQAEAAEKPLVFNAKFKEFPEFVTAQEALYKQRKLGMKEDLDTLREALEMAQDELKMNTALFSTGDTSRLEVMRAKRQLGELQGRINAVRNKYQQDARQESTKLAEELSSSRYKLQEQQSILRHTVLTAPAAGIVKFLKVTTIGGVLRAGDELMQISPTDGDMVIEIKINPADIGLLKAGLPVSIKLDAFDYSVYGSLAGSLIYISSDTLNEQAANGQTSTYYRAQVRLNSNPESHNAKLADVVLKPGMTATVDIFTNRRTVLEYLAKPVFKAFGGAMNER